MSPGVHMFLPVYLWCRGVREHAAQGHRKQTSGETPGGTLARVGTQREWWGGGGGPAALVGP